MAGDYTLLKHGECHTPVARFRPLSLTGPARREHNSSTSAICRNIAPSLAAPTCSSICVCIRSRIAATRAAFLFARRLQLQQESACIFRVDPAFHEPLGLQRRDRMAHVATRGFKRSRQFRRPHAFLLEKDRCQHQRFGEGQTFLLQQGIQRCFHPARDPACLKGRTLLQERLNPQGGFLHTSSILVEWFNYLSMDKTTSTRTSSVGDDLSVFFPFRYRLPFLLVLSCLPLAAQQSRTPLQTNEVHETVTVTTAIPPIPLSSPTDPSRYSTPASSRCSTTTSPITCDRTRR